MGRRSPQPGAGRNANLRQAVQGYIRAAKQRPRALGQNVFAAIVDEVNFGEGRRLEEWEAGTAVRLLKESSERLANGELLPGQAAASYGTIVRKLKKMSEAERRGCGYGSRVAVQRIVVKLVNGQEVVTDHWNLEKVTTLDLLAACAGEE